MTDYIWWLLGAGVVAVIFWQFGVKTALLAALALFGIRVVRQERERGASDERARQANQVEEVRQRHDEIAGKAHNPSDAYEHLRGLSDDDK